MNFLNDAFGKVSSAAEAVKNNETLRQTLTTAGQGAATVGKITLNVASDVAVNAYNYASPRRQGTVSGRVLNDEEEAKEEQQGVYENFNNKFGDFFKQQKDKLIGKSQVDKEGNHYGRANPKYEASSILLENYIRQYKFDQIQNLLGKEQYPIDNLSPSGYSPLHTACALNDRDENQKSFNKKMLELIWQFKPDINLIGQFGRTPLHCAAHVGSLTAIKFLIKRGVIDRKDDEQELDINALNTGKETPLIKAAASPHCAKKVCIQLLEAGANPFAEDCLGRRADQYAEIQNYENKIHKQIRHYMLAISGEKLDKDTPVQETRKAWLQHSKNLKW